MSNQNKNVQSSGALSRLLESKDILRIDDAFSMEEAASDINKKATKYKTQSGVVFNENELFEVDPKECEPWKYANRLDNELGDIDELAKSIHENKQLQPALVRTHPSPHDGIKYEIIFGRRRYEACLKLGIKLLVIKKDISDTREAILLQDAENKLRKNVSNYSNSLLYKKLIQDGVFFNEADAAKKIGIPFQTFNDLMTFSKIPNEIARLIPNIHTLSIAIARKIISLLNESNENHAQLVRYAKHIGESIKSPAALEKMLKNNGDIQKIQIPARFVQTLDGRRLFSINANHKGKTQLILDKNLEKNHKFDKEDFYNYLAKYFEEKMGLSVASV